MYAISTFSYTSLVTSEVPFVPVVTSLVPPMELVLLVVSPSSTGEPFVIVYMLAVPSGIAVATSEITAAVAVIFTFILVTSVMT